MIPRKRIIHVHDRSPRREQTREAKNYTDGAEGFFVWCEDNACIPIYPEGEELAVWVPMASLPKDKHPRTGKSYSGIWEEQKKVMREALRMEAGRFVYNLIVLCWMRGEGKSLLACLIQLWKFFNWTKQTIALGANSKDQVKFVHYDIIKDIIVNSPKLLNKIGLRNIQEKEIHIKGEKGNVLSMIRAISSFSGIVSNITGFTFSEIFDMKNPKFYSQLYGSIRNMPNALGVIDSTVSDKRHILYKLFQNWEGKRARKLFFSYRKAVLGIPDEYWNPNMDDFQLNDYKENLPFGEFERYFQNLWEAGSQKIFTDEQIEETSYIGIDGGLMNHADVERAIRDKTQYQLQKINMEEKGIFTAGEELDEKVMDIENRLWTTDQAFNIARTTFDSEHPLSSEVLIRLGDMLDTNWAILAGTDFGDPLSVRSSARTIFSCIAKGLMGSRSSKFEEGPAPKYIYLLLFLAHIENHSLESVKLALERCHEEYEGIDTYCQERYGIGDLVEWCEERNIILEAVYPAYERQKIAFKEFVLPVKQGRFKAPTISVPGSKSNDILREEMSIFDHDSEKKWFGSREKSEKYGVQDDVIYCIAWTIYGGRLIGVDDFRQISGMVNFGTFIENKALLGRY